MFTNHYIEIGSDHKVCQDYAMSGTCISREFGITEYAIVCDGCSSAKFSEFGAQVLAHGAVKQIKNESYRFITAADAVHHARLAVKVLDLPLSVLASSLLVATADEEKVVVGMFGDGAAKIELTSGEEEIITIEYGDNAPYYPLYHTDPDMREAYTNAFANTKTVMSVRSMIVDVQIIDIPAHHDTVRVYDRNEVISVTLMSDGVESYRNPDMTKVETEDVIKEFTSFKQAQGEYIERRMKAFKRKCTAAGITHYDDISSAGFQI